MTRRTLTVFQISELANKNGPGLRTMIHFKGCPMRCLWCSTPESQTPEPELMIDRDKCISCSNCVSACPNHANLNQKGKILHIWDQCRGTLTCSASCPTCALTISGKEYTPDELISIIKRGKAFFDHTGGGVTISGGEPLIWSDELFSEFLCVLKEACISVGIDTTGHVPWNNISRILPFTDFFLWDLKHINSEKHRQYTGVGNELILENLRKADDSGVKIYLRCPIIPGYTDDEENLMGILETASSMNSLEEVHLIPLHHYGTKRYKMLGRKYPFDPHLKTDPSVLNIMRDTLALHHIPCKII